jgi:hypothetical protein
MRNVIYINNFMTKVAHTAATRPSIKVIEEGSYLSKWSYMTFAGVFGG